MKKESAEGESYESWQLRIYRHSLKKKQKVKLLRSLIPPLDNKLCLDLGCAKGTISYFLRQMGGRWVSVDLDYTNLVAAKELVRENVVQIEPHRFPFRNGSFDVVVALDILEHVEDDEDCLREIKRTLKEKGEFYLSTPSVGWFHIVNLLKRKSGLTLEEYGHVREGYKLKVLIKRLEQEGFQVVFSSTYSRFFTEFIEYVLNLVYNVVFGRRKKEKLRDGRLTISSAQEYKHHQKKLRLYNLVYPILWLLSQGDRMLFFLQGYALLIHAQKSSP
ncbi:hypothetical protein CEE39_07400 [bacterium (candidate division B38) B3_B38]|nr:MAG: hypothetical protein CEE39_07400 [bacterium (candidate division B38) B3_B38]